MKKSALHHKANFWQQWAKRHTPFFCLAPMEDVTDIAFREMFVKYSKGKRISFKENHTPLPSVTWLRADGRHTWYSRLLAMLALLRSRQQSSDLGHLKEMSSEPKSCGRPSGDIPSMSQNLVLFTEFTPSDGLAFGDEKAQERLRAKLSYTEGQRPIVAQIYNSNPQRMEDAAALVQELGFDGVDINMGCPVNAVVKQVSGAALIKHPELAVSLMQAVRRGAPNIPLSVKTRVGYSSVSDMQDWLAKILAEKPEALTVHLRTRSQMSKVPAQWELMKEVIKLRDEISPNTVIIGNGDVQSVAQGKALASKYGCDGIMVGRGAYGTPDFFLNAPIKKDKATKIKMLIEHLELFDEMLLKKDYKKYHVMKKHFKAYIAGWHGAKELRAKLMQTNTPEEAANMLHGDMK